MKHSQYTNIKRSLQATQQLIIIIKWNIMLLWREEIEQSETEMVENSIAALLMTVENYKTII